MTEHFQSAQVQRPLPFEYPRLDEIPSELREEVQARRSLNVYKMIMHSPRVAPGFLALTDALRHQSSLPGTWRELAILRVGHRYAAPYEIHHHERLARSVGLREAAIAASGVGPSDMAFTADERLVLELTDELLDRHGLSGPARAKALGRLGADQLADLVLTVGYYQMVCNFLNTFAVPIEG